MSDNIKIEISFGTGHDKDNKPIDSLALFRAINQIEKLALSLFGGYTWVETEGGWLDENQIAICEPGKTLSIMTNSNKQHEARQLAVFIRDQINQSCVCLTITPVQFTFI